MLPPTINIIRHYMDTDGKGRDDVFAIVQFDGDDNWHDAAWSVPIDDFTDAAENHAEARLAAGRLVQFIDRFSMSHRNKPAVCTITLKYSPCPDCGENQLGDVVQILRGEGINEYYLYYLEEYRGAGSIAFRNGLDSARRHFGDNMLEYDAVPERRRQWAGIRRRYAGLGKV